MKIELVLQVLQYHQYPNQLNQELNLLHLPLVLRPQDVTVSFNDAGDGASAIGGPSFSALPIQSASIELPLAREVIEALGNELAYAKLLEFPIDVTMSISSLTRDFASPFVIFFNLLPFPPV